MPGRYPWRILSYREGGKWSSSSNSINEFATPIEQDTFVMDIPFVSISVLQAYSSSLNANDNDNILHIRSNFQPFIIHPDGAINLNFTHVEDNYQDKAAWPIKVGVSMSDNSVKEVPCKVYINNARTGRLTNDWNYHRNVRCYAKSGNSASKDNLYI